MPKSARRYPRRTRSRKSGRRSGQKGSRGFKSGRGDSRGKSRGSAHRHTHFVRRHSRPARRQRFRGPAHDYTHKYWYKLSIVGGINYYSTIEVELYSRKNDGKLVVKVGDDMLPVLSHTSKQGETLYYTESGPFVNTAEQKRDTPLAEVDKMLQARPPPRPPPAPRPHKEPTGILDPQGISTHNL